MKCHGRVVKIHLALVAYSRGRDLLEDRVLTPHTDVAFAADDRATGASGAPAKRTPTSDGVLEIVLSSLADDKAEDVVQIDLRGRTEIADHMVVCSGRSSRQVAAISEKLAEKLKSEFGLSVRSEGRGTGDWVLLDAGDVIVHVFRPEVREFYQLEKMWQPDAPDAPSADS